MSVTGVEDTGDPPKISGNIWGWKWSYISLVVIIAGFLFLIFVGPKETGEQVPQESADTTRPEQTEAQP